MKRNIAGTIFLLATLMLSLAAVASAQGPSINSIDAPGAGTGFLQGTIGWAINPAGAITGIYADSSSVNHGFLRAPDGTFTTIDAPGAGGGAGQGTGAFGINPAGAITGVYLDASCVAHGYLRAPDGTITTFDAPGAATTPVGCLPLSDVLFYLILLEGTIPSSINPSGAITGSYRDAGNVWHGFLRAPDGTFTTIDAPNAGTGAFQGTLSSGINPEGAITGVYTDSSSVGHGFLRAPDGTFTTIDAPGAAGGAGQGTFGFGINPAGAIAGIYFDASFVAHGYLRAPNGTFATFDAPGAGTFHPPGFITGTFSLSVNPARAITGFYITDAGVFHGFLRIP